MYFILPILRTVPTFVSAHTFCALRKPWFKQACAGVDIDAINYANKYTTKLKQNFCTLTKLKLMNQYLNQKHQNSSISLTTKCLRLPAENLVVIFSKITLKSNCKYVPEDDVVRTQKRKCLTGEVTGKNVRGTVKVNRELKHARF